MFSLHLLKALERWYASQHCTSATQYNSYNKVIFLVFVLLFKAGNSWIVMHFKYIYHSLSRVRYLQWPHSVWSLALSVLWLYNEVVKPEKTESRNVKHKTYIMYMY